MTNCKDCKHYNPESDRHGWCSIEVPPWIRLIVTNLTDSRFVHADAGCDFGKKRSETLPVSKVGDENGT